MPARKVIVFCIIHTQRWYFLLLFKWFISGIVCNFIDNKGLCFSGDTAASRSAQGQCFRPLYTIFAVFFFSLNLINSVIKFARFNAFFLSLMFHFFPAMKCLSFILHWISKTCSDLNLIMLWGDHMSVCQKHYVW